MDIDKDWIKAKIADRRGIQTKLAHHVGISPNQMTKVMTGERRIQGDEVLKIIDFFENYDVRAPGFAEASAIAPTPQPRKDMANLLGETNQKPTEDTPFEKGISIGFKDGYVQILATVDLDGLIELEEKIPHIKELMRLSGK